MPFSDPEKRREYDSDSKRKARAAEPCPTRLALPAEFRAKTAADVLALLNEQLETLRQDASLGSVERAKGVGYLAGIALRAIEAGGTIGSVGVDLEITTEGKGRGMTNGVAKRYDRRTVQGPAWKLSWR